MKILLIGSGGREHAIALKLSQSPKLTQLYTAPGNPGTAQLGKNIDIQENQSEKLVKFAKENQIDITFVGPEAPLASGLVDLFQKHDLSIIGPNQEGALLESSKSWAKSKMKAYNIPTADYKEFIDFETSKRHIQTTKSYPIVIKANGLAAGKGVTIAQSEDEAITALQDCFLNNIFKEAGQKVIIESFLKGEEASIFAFTDGKTVIPMVPSQDHKAIYDGDKGPNTGGMGAYSPAPIVSTEMEKRVLDTVFKPLVEGFQKDNIKFNGIIYAGLMIEGDEINVVEFNARFGDPETQVVLPRLETDLLEIFEAITTQSLENLTLKWNTTSAVCIVLASKGYPQSYEKGKVITGIDSFSNNKNTWVIQAGTKQSESNTIVTNGGRVLNIISQADTLETAINQAYECIPKIQFEGAYYRKDIGQKGLKRLSFQN